MELDDFVEEVLMLLSKEPNARTRSSEYMGLVYEDKSGTLNHTPFIELGKTGGQAPVRIPLDTVLRAIVHNHPDTHKRSVPGALSRDDTAAANQLRVPIYVLSQAGAGHGETVRYTPGTPEGDDYTIGEKVLAQFPIEEIRKQFIDDVSRRRK